MFAGQIISCCAFNAKSAVEIASEGLHLVCFLGCKKSRLKKFLQFASEVSWCESTIFKRNGLMVVGLLESCKERHFTLRKESHLTLHSPDPPSAVGQRRDFW